jgi:hypothetical protein
LSFIGKLLTEDPIFYFSAARLMYVANEALHLSDKEKETIITIFKIIDEELSSHIDDFSCLNL